jgi:hypothetical protein
LGFSKKRLGDPGLIEEETYFMIRQEMFGMMDEEIDTLVVWIIRQGRKAAFSKKC